MNESSNSSQVNADALFTILRSGDGDHLHAIFEELERKWEHGESDGFSDNSDNDSYRFSMELSYDFKKAVQNYLETSDLRHQFNKMTDDWKLFVTITLFDDWMFRTKTRPK